MNLYSAYCNGADKGDLSGIAYVIFKDGQFLEEYVENVTNNTQGTRYLRTYALRKLVERLDDIGAKDVRINLSCQMTIAYVNKLYNKHIVRKDSLQQGFERSDFYKIIKGLSKIKWFSLREIPLDYNTRAQFLSRKYITKDWEHTRYNWRNEYPTKNERKFR